MNIVIYGLLLCTVTSVSGEVEIQKADQGIIVRDRLGYPCIDSIEQVCQMTPLTPDQVRGMAALAKEEQAKLFNAILTCKKEDWSRETVLKTLDRIYMWQSSTMSTIGVVKETHPDETMKDVCAQEIKKLREFHVEKFSSKELFCIITAYSKDVVPHELLSQEDRFFLDHVLENFDLMGMNLPEEEQVNLRKINKRIAYLQMIFNKNVSNSCAQIVFPLSDLIGLSEDFLASCKQEEGKYIIPVNRATYQTVLLNAQKEAVRKAMHVAFFKLAYPENTAVVQELAMLLNKKARIQGYASTIEKDLPTQGIQSEERAWAFLRELQAAVIPLETQRLQEMCKDLPEGVSLTEDGKVNAWDLPYLTYSYVKKHYALDMNEVANYFPLEPTIEKLMHIYESFFDVVIEKIAIPKMWHPDVQLVRVTKKDGVILGYLFLDLFARESKYYHPKTFAMVEGIDDPNNLPRSAVVTLSCTFAKPAPGHTTLLKPSEIQTFFHEFGHAMHIMFAKAKLYHQSGIKHLETDILEVPSQALEIWIEDPEILTLISKHHQTGAPLPHDMIEKLVKTIEYDRKTLTSVPTQLYLSMFLLTLFGPETEECIDKLAEKFREENFPGINFGDEDYRYCSQPHIGSALCRHRYYGYLWDRAIAIDIFEQIKKEGLRNPEAGKRYVKAFLARGATMPGCQMLRDYLGREPQFDVFI